MRCTHRPKYFEYVIASLFRTEFVCRSCYKRIRQTELSLWIDRALIFFPIYFVFSNLRIQNLELQKKIPAMIIIAVFLLFLAQTLSYFLIAKFEYTDQENNESTNNDTGDD